MFRIMPSTLKYRLHESRKIPVTAAIMPQTGIPMIATVMMSPAQPDVPDGRNIAMSEKRIDKAKRTRETHPQEDPPPRWPLSSDPSVMIAFSVLR